MAAKVKPIPDGFHTVTPYLIVDGAKKVIDFMQQALGAKHDHEPTLRPDGKIMHAALKIGRFHGDGFRRLGTCQSHARHAVSLCARCRCRLSARASRQAPPLSWSRRDQFYGDRSGGVKDAAGNSWFFGTHIEDVAPAELKRRAAEAIKKQKAA